MNWMTLLARYRASADPVRTERRIELVVVLLALLLILQLGFGAFRLASVSTPEAIVPAADSLQVISSLGQNVPTPDERNEIRSRPLLWPQRRPVANADIDEAERGGAKQQKLNEIELLGVFGAGDSLGIIARSQGNTRRVRRGEEIGGWTLKSVERSQAVFANGPRQKTIVLVPNQIDQANKVKK